MTAEKQSNGSQDTSDTSTPDFLMKMNALMDPEARNSPIAEDTSSFFRPARSMRTVATYDATSCMKPMTIEDILGDSVDPDSMKMMEEYDSIANNPDNSCTAINVIPIMMDFLATFVSGRSIDQSMFILFTCF